MGLAIACATNNRIVLKCDDSPLTGASDQETGSKIKSFDDTILLAYTGDKAFCEQAVTAFERLYKWYWPTRTLTATVLFSLPGKKMKCF